MAAIYTVHASFISVFSYFPFTAPVSATSELSQLPMATEVIVPSTQVKISEVDTTKYIHIRQNGTSARVFRETSVWPIVFLIIQLASLWGLVIFFTAQCNIQYQQGSSNLFWWWNYCFLCLHRNRLRGPKLQIKGYPDHYFSYFSMKIHVVILTRSTPVRHF